VPTASSQARRPRTESAAYDLGDSVALYCLPHLSVQTAGLLTCAAVKPPDITLVDREPDTVSTSYFSDSSHLFSPERRTRALSLCLRKINPYGRPTMADHDLDLDQLAIRLRAKMETKGLSIRAAAKEIGLGAATLSRLLQGSENSNTPDLANVSKAAEWVGRSLADFSALTRRQAPTSTIADVEVHLRALPGLDRTDAEALVAMVKAGYESAKKLRSKKHA
jgi:transcriptional regulator with XRE-family HTH domain